MIEIEEYSKEYEEQVRELQFKQEDVNEMEKLTGLKSEDVIDFTLNDYGDYLFVLKYNDKVSGIFGVVPDREINTIGVGIFITDENIFKYKKDLIRNTTIAVDYFLERYEIIYNYCPASYTKSLKWLEKTCGAIIEKEDYIFNGELFRRFFISRETIKHIKGN